jgi:lysophospholipase L1-like esterase
MFSACIAAPRPTALSPAVAPFAAEIARFIEADRAAPPAPCQILFLGSSSIVLWKTLATDMAPLPVINRGFGGSQIPEVSYWFDKIVAPYHSRAIVFYAGENDIAEGKTPEQVAADFDAFMSRKTRALGKVPVYFISLKPSKLRFEQLERQSRVNEKIRRRARERADLRFIDIVPLMLENGRPKDLYMPDNLHMRPEGYALWTEAVRAALLPETEQQAQQCRETLSRGGVGNHGGDR